MLLLSTVTILAVNGQRNKNRIASIDFFHFIKKISKKNRNSIPKIHFLLVEQRESNTTVGRNEAAQLLKNAISSVI